MLNLTNFIKKNIFFKTICDISYINKYKSYISGDYVKGLLLNNINIMYMDILVIGNISNLIFKINKKLNNNIYIISNYKNKIIKINYIGMNIKFISINKLLNINLKYNKKIDKYNKILYISLLNKYFTIDSIIISLIKNYNFGCIIDPFNGLKDINDRKIKTILNSSKIYHIKPILMIKSINKAIEIDFKLSFLSIFYIRKNRMRIFKVSTYNIFKEINKIMLSKYPSIGIELLYRSGLLNIIFPELCNMHINNENIINNIEICNNYIMCKDNFYHTLQVLDNICSMTNKLWLRWATLFHDIGKIKTKSYNNKFGYTFRKHEIVGSNMIRNIFNRLKLHIKNNILLYIKSIIRNSSRPIYLISRGGSDNAIRRLIVNMKNNTIYDLLLLCKSDITTKDKFKKDIYYMKIDILFKRIKKIIEKDKNNFKSPISGFDIMKILKLHPCKLVGNIKNDVIKKVLSKKIKNTYNDAYKYIINKYYNL